MSRLDDVSVPALRRTLEEVEGKKPTQRLTAAIAYKRGVTQTEIADWYGVERKTVYSWLRRIESEPLPEAVRDDERSGRPRKLAEGDREQLEGTLRNSPRDAGYDAETWSPPLVQRHVAETFDVSYSLPSCRRVMRSAGLRYRRNPDSEDEGPVWELSD